MPGPSLSRLQPIEITVWQDESDEAGWTFATYVDEVQERYFSVPEPSDARAHEYLKTGSIVGATISTRQGPVIFYPSIHSRQPDGQGYWLRIPDDFEFVQRRQHVRAEMALPITVNRITDAGLDWDTFQTQTINLSGGGLAFFSPVKLMRGGEIEVVLQMQKETPPLHLKALVVFVRENPKNRSSETLYQVGAQFTDLTEAAQSALVSKCFQWQLKTRRAEY